MRYFQDVVENKLDTKEWPHQSECPAAWNGSGAVRWVFVSDQAGTGLLFWFLSNWRIYSLTTLQFCVVVSLSYAYTVSLCDLSLHIHFLFLRGLIEVNKVDFPVSAVRSSVCFFFLCQLIFPMPLLLLHSARQKHRGSTQDDRRTGSRLIIFVIGGISFSEMRCAYEVTRTVKSCEVIIGKIQCKETAGQCFVPNRRAESQNAGKY